MQKQPPISNLLIPLPATVGVIGALVGAAISRSWLISILAFITSAILSALVAFFGSDAITEKEIDAKPLTGHAKAVIDNHLEELCARTGANRPEVLTVGHGMPAVASYGRIEPKLVITDDVVEVFSSVELEAVIARELVKIRSGKTAVDTLAVAFLTKPFGWLGGVGKTLLRKARGEGVEALLDLETVEVTRYPPALTAALEKMAYPVPTSSPSVRHLWAVPTAEPIKEPGTFSLQDRLTLLREL